MAILCKLHLKSGNPVRAGAVVSAALDRGEVGPEDLLPMCEAEVLCVRGELDTARGVAELLSAPRRWLVEAMIAHRRAEDDGDWEGMLTRLAEAFDATNNASYLLDAAQGAARIGRWDWVVETLAPHLETLDTTYSVSLAARALLDARKARDAADLLDRHLVREPDNAAQLGLRALRAHALACWAGPGRRR